MEYKRSCLLRFALNYPVFLNKTSRGDSLAVGYVATVVAFCPMRDSPLGPDLSYLSIPLVFVTDVSTFGLTQQHVRSFQVVLLDGNDEMGPPHKNIPIQSNSCKCLSSTQMLDLLAVQALEFERLADSSQKRRSQMKQTFYSNAMVGEKVVLLRFLKPVRKMLTSSSACSPGHCVQTPWVCSLPAVLVVVSLGALVEAGSFPDLLLLDPRSVPAEVPQLPASYLLDIDQQSRGMEEYERVSILIGLPVF
ncbi:hypothetical protein Tco_1044124 [Tanacetum coccineum]|uniref:Uncharacterized protein n=1 Tax=Tanacetum coccineum TaxID=301880 RepID=A0ABQ5GQ19_9ASTR